MLARIGIALAVIVVVLAVVIALQPSEFRVVRSATIAAPPAVVFAQINDLGQWKAWSPWETIDPAMKKTFSGPAAGVGASFAWAGNYEVGEGRLTITESRPHELVRIRLDMITPMAASHLVEFTLQPQGDETVVTWGMTGRNTFVSKAVHLIMDMDTMVGGQFEKGLASLRQAAGAAKRS